MKKEILIPALLVFLGLIFIIFNLIVYFSRGNAWFIAKKIKVGALILSLTAFISCGPNANSFPVKNEPITKDFKDSIAEKNRQDSMEALNKKRRIEDSIVMSIKKGEMQDSIKPVMCYKPAPSKKNNKK